jgi:methanogenic corrinoid protein MtbC1
MGDHQPLYRSILAGDEDNDRGLNQAGVRHQVKVIVGGAPITQNYADEIGANGCTETAAGAVALARKVAG